MAEQSSITPERSFATLKENIVKTISSYFPFEGRTQKLVLNKIWVDDDLDIDNIKEQALAKDHERTWGVPIKADISLVDVVTGKTLDKRKMTLARLPKITKRYGFIVDGNEYQVDHLFRLKSGVYARVQANGDLESEFNLAKSPAGNFSVKLEREKKRFSLKHGESHIPLYPLLKAMGTSDEQLEKDWGKEILEANRPKDEKKTLKALHDFFRKTSEDDQPEPKSLTEYTQHVRNIFDQTTLYPETTQITLGKGFDKVNGEALRMAAGKILGVSRGELKPDDRDSLAFKEVVSVEDFLPEKIDRNARTIKGKLRQNINHKKSVIEILSPDLFNKPVHEFFAKGGSLSERSDQTNPIQMYSGHRKTTLISPDFGGIKNEFEITNEMQVVNPSHFGFLDPMHTPESERTGITLHLGMGVRKNGKNLETPVYDLKTGKITYSKVVDFHLKTAVLPDQVQWVHGKPVPIASEVRVKLPGGDIEMRPFKDADYVMPSAKAMFNVSSNLIPFLPSDQGNRVSMADKQLEQAISLKYREAPLVQAKTDHPDPTHTFEKLVGAFNTTRTPVSGKVIAVHPDRVVIQEGKKKHEVTLYDHFPLNDPKGMMHSEVVVKEGDTVKAGQLIADTNFTKKGQLALGSNLRVGYIPYKGYNYEDGIVISDTAAKKLTSEHLYKKKLELDPENDLVSKNKFLAFASTRAAQLTKEQIEGLGDDGLIRVGSKVTNGSVLIAAVGKNIASRQSSALASLGKRAFSDWRDKSLVWDEDHVGTVVRVVKDPTGRNHKIYVRTEEAAVVGDKLSGRHGNKGIITQILPEHEMPFTTEKGEKKPLEVLLNPSGVPTRINVGQLLETAAGKVAEKTGKTYIVNNFAGPHHNYRQQVLNDLKTQGLEDEEQVYDPKDPRRPLGHVLVGPQYILKLQHQVEKKLSVRGGGTDVQGKGLSYSSDNQPQRGGERGGQGFGSLELYSLLGHNARHNLREMSSKSDKMDHTFWNLVQEGHEPPPPRVPFAYEKFIALLKGAGINITKTGTAFQMSPLTDKHILELAGGSKGEIKSGNLMIRSKDLKEEKDGLFDRQVTGGLTGSKWAFIRMAEPMPNPIFVGQHNRPGPIPSLLNLKREHIDKIMKGAMELNGKTGGAAIEAALKGINVDKEIQDGKARIANLKGADLDRANRKLKYLFALKEAGLRPDEAYVLHYLPIIPPVFRPATATPRGDINYNSVNGLYKNFAILNQKLKEFDPKLFTVEHKHPLRYSLYDSLKALQSVGGSVGYDTDAGRRMKLKGILHIIGGGDEEQPKEGFFQEKLVKKRVNLSIRSTIVPEPKLGIDEVGLPKDAAMELYKPFVVAELGKYGYDPLSAQQELKKGSPAAFKALERVVHDRPLILKRDPALHKFSVMAFRPTLVEGKAIQIHPLVTGGFNADFDGDAMAGTVPLSREAVEEAKKMFPSANLFSPTSGSVMYTPSQEAMLGLHLLSRWGKKTGKSFKTALEADKAADRGDISHTDVIKVGGTETTLGRLRIAARLPDSFATKKEILSDPQFSITKKSLGALATTLAKEHTRDFAKAINELKDLGNLHSYEAGFSFGLKDLAPLKERDRILSDAKKKVDQIKKATKDPQEREQKVIEAYQKATEQIDLAASKRFKPEDRLATMIYSGARGKPEQYRQMIAAPMLMQDATDRTIPTPVTKSYAEGLDVGDYWLAQHGARKGTLQRAKGTKDPGALSKDVINTTIATLIVSSDCKTNQGILMDIKHKDIHDRYTAAPYKLKDGHTLPAGTLLTPEVLSKMRNAKVDKILVRSPLKCQHGEGICAKCFGLSENGTPHDVGTNIGVLAGQALGEPAVQMAMDSFHTGGLATGRGAISIDRFTRLRNLLAMPKKLKNSATVARTSGKIEQVKKDEVGGIDIYINGERHYVPKNLVKPGLKVGSEIKRGDALSEGFINPHHLLENTDIHAVQNYLANQMYDGLYEKEGVRRRNVEVVVRGVTNLTKIKDPGHSDYLQGDVVPRSVVDEHNRSVPKGKKPVIHEPILQGINQIPLVATNDWMARLNYRRLADTIQAGAAQGWKSDIHGSHPIPGMAYGAEFGKPPPEVKSKKPYSY